MHPQMNRALAAATAAGSPRGGVALAPRPGSVRRGGAPSGPTIRWQGLTLRLATSADGSALNRPAPSSRGRPPRARRSRFCWAR